MQTLIHFRRMLGAGLRRLTACYPSRARQLELPLRFEK